MKHCLDFYEDYLPDGYVICDFFNIDIPLKRIGFGIPKELIGNEIVISKIDNIRSNFYKLKDTLKNARTQEELLKTKFLDIEKKPYIEQIHLLKEEALKYRDEMNKDLSPYHWDWLNFQDIDLLVLANSNEYSEDYLLHEILYTFIRMKQI